MKKIKYLFSTLLIFSLIFQSCEDIEDVEQPDFKISFNKTVKVGEPVEFSVENAPNFLYFYAGDFGHEYKYKDRTNAEGTVTMSFKNSQKWGIGANKEGNLTVWYSKDYDGSGEVDAVKNATWTEISDRFNISKLYDFTLQESGIVDVTDLADGNTIFFAFKYFADDLSSRPSEWYVDDLDIKMNATGAPAPLTVASETDPGFKTVDVQGVDSRWNANKWYFDTGKGTNGLWRMRGQVKISGNWVVNEDWLITNPINLTKVSPDKGVALKTYSEKLNVFTHTYNTPGTYTITLVGNNTTIYGNKEIIKEYEIVVE